MRPRASTTSLCTHLHLDHVGWNTRLDNGKWVPTFPNASYLMDQKELDLFSNIDPKAEDEFLQVQRLVYDDSVQPVMDAGLAKAVEGPSPVCEGVRLIATPGHTPGHCSVIIESRGESAMITGDFIHHPIQFHDPGLVSPFDVDNDAAVATRRRVFAEYAGTPTLIIGTPLCRPDRRQAGAGWGRLSPGCVNAAGRLASAQARGAQPTGRSCLTRPPGLLSTTHSPCTGTLFSTHSAAGSRAATRKPHSAARSVR